MIYHKDLLARLIPQLMDRPQWIRSNQALLLPIDQLQIYQSQLESSMPELAARMAIAGYDWLGRPFGVDTTNTNTILLYDAIFDELMEFLCPNAQLVKSDLLSSRNDTFGVDEFNSFVGKNRLDKIDFGYCAGFSVPPQLGGVVSAQNMELYNIFTYWHYASMLHDVLSTLPEGATLRQIIIE